MKALILAAGYAVRLYPLTRDYPKPLLWIGKRPIIDYIVDKIKAVHKIDEIIVVTNSKFYSLFKKWARTKKLPQRLSIVDDLTSNPSGKRGAIGDMDFVIQKRRLRDDLLVIGGDNLFDGKISDFIAFAKRKKNNPVIGVYDLKDIYNANKYGVIKLDKHNKIADFKEKPKRPQSTLVAMCLYYFPKTKLRLVKEYLETKTDKHDATGFYIDWLRKKEPVYGFVFGGRWYDIGHRNFYHEAKGQLF